MILEREREREREREEGRRRRRRRKVVSILLFKKFFLFRLDIPYNLHLSRGKTW